MIGGLFLHPYQTMQYLVEEKVFIWLAFIPVPLYLLAAMIWWVSLKVFYMSFAYIGLWAFSLIWITLFFTFWQVLLLYLLIRFFVTLR